MKFHNIFIFIMVILLCACSGPSTITSSNTLITSPEISLSYEATSSLSTMELITVTSTLPPEELPTIVTLTPTLTLTIPKPTATKTIPPMPALTRNLRLESPLMRGDDVAYLQTWLLALGYTNIGSADGVFGELTDASVRLFQENYNLTVDGVVGPLTWSALYQAAFDLPDPTPTSKPPTAVPGFEVLSKGDSGKIVDDLQGKLISLGYPICEHLGFYDLQTETAVRLFQAENGLAADGMVSSWTWSVLNSLAAKKYQQPEVPVYSVSNQYPLEKGAWAFAMDKNYLWFYTNEQVIKFDPASMQFINAISLPYLGQQTGPDGVKYDVRYGPMYIFPPLTGNQIWLMGGYGFGYGPGSDATLSINTTGKLLITPYLFPGDYSYGAVLDALYVNNEIWAFHHLNGEVILYLVDYTGGLIPSSYMGYEFSDTSAYTWDGSRLWALIATEGFALASVDAYGASYGKGIGPCGSDLAWDGTWLWVLREDKLYAYDTSGQLQAIASPPDGYEIREFVANNKYIAASASGKGKNFIIIFNK